MTFPQIGGMYAGDRARKENLVENGFRLASAFDNRPLRFEEFESKIPCAVAVSATPGPYEIERSGGEQFAQYNPLRDGIWKGDENNRIIAQTFRPT